MTGFLDECGEIYSQFSTTTESSEPQSSQEVFSPNAEGCKTRNTRDFPKLILTAERFKLTNSRGEFKQRVSNKSNNSNNGRRFESS
jgi:hypothetical protein